MFEQATGSHRGLGRSRAVCFAATRP